MGGIKDGFNPAKRMEFELLDRWAHYVDICHDEKQQLDGVFQTRTMCSHRGISQAEF